MVLSKSILYFAWITALTASIGSIYFSEVAHFPPCVLCWYQRVFMLPLVFIIAVGILRKAKDIHHYVLPLSITGLIIGIYHNLLYFKIIPESNAPCVAGVSCTTKFIEWFGFISIPFLSLTAFSIITACMLIFRRAVAK